MATERQIRANQRNAKLSTGPRTVAGLAKSAQNRRPHGFTSRDALLTTPEDRVAFDSMQDEYLAFYDTGHPDCREYVSAAVNAEFQRRFILRAQKGHFEESVRLTIDHVWGSQRFPDDAQVNHDLLTRLIGITVRRDLREDEIFLKSSRYAVEQFRLFDRAIKVLRKNLEQNCISVESSATEPAETTVDTALTHGAPTQTAGDGSVPSPDTAITRGATTPAAIPRTRSVSEVVEPASEPGEAQGFSPGLTKPTTEKTIENPISDLSQLNQTPTLCKNHPGIDACVVCRHPEYETLREILTLPHDIHKISAKWNIPILDLWHCRLHHLEDPTDFYSIIGAAARKARLLDATDLNPQVALSNEELEARLEQLHTA